MKFFLRWVNYSSEWDDISNMHDAPAMAGDLISGAQLKDHVRSVLMSRGLNSRPVISDTRQFRACENPLQVTPMFGGYKTVRLTCPDVDGFKIAIRTQIDSFVEWPN